MKYGLILDSDKFAVYIEDICVRLGDAELDLHGLASFVKFDGFYL